jgi:hypothetical protein
MNQQEIDIIIQFMKSQIEWEYFIKNQLESIKPNKLKSLGEKEKCAT